MVGRISCLAEVFHMGARRWPKHLFCGVDGGVSFGSLFAVTGQMAYEPRETSSG